MCKKAKQQTKQKTKQKKTTLTTVMSMSSTLHLFNLLTDPEIQHGIWKLLKKTLLTYVVYEPVHDS